ncbi:MAG: hypothetical protein EON61_06180 [Alphaproteobacteria bacterium]|nr:MAG: hypothetical protein EON61_06180 [Alphaproteobacteria bacterium]
MGAQCRRSEIRGLTSASARSPDIAVPQSDHTRLLRLAETLSRRCADLGNRLFQALERAEILPDDTRRAIVRMGTSLDYETENGDTRTVTLLFPHDEDISVGRVSVLTPVGVALLGLSAGHEMDSCARWPGPALESHESRLASRTCCRRDRDDRADNDLSSAQLTWAPTQ